MQNFDDLVNKLNIHYTQKVLPLAYDDSISYYESICKMVDKVNEMVDFVNNIETNILDEAKAYSDIVGQAGKDYTDNKVSDFLNLLDINTKAIEETNTKIDNVENNLIVDIDTKYVRTQQTISQMWEDMKKYIADQVFETKVRNFFTGQMVSLQSMFDYLAVLHLTDAGTYAQVSGNNTYQHYVNKNETYSNVIIESRTFFNS